MDYKFNYVMENISVPKELNSIFKDVLFQKPSDMNQIKVLLCRI